MKKLQQLIVTQETKIIDAIHAIDKGAVGAVIVVNDVNKLIGIVTDGDVRRALLNQVCLQDEITHIMNATPKKAVITDEPRKVLNMMQEFSLKHIPIVDQDDHLVDIKIINDFLQQKKQDNTVMIMAGGQGTRLRPLTENCPKPLLKIENKPVLEIILERFIDCGFENFIFSINYKGDMIKQHFSNGEKWDVNIEYLEEYKALGTAGALSLLSKKPTKPMIICNGDIMTTINFAHLLDFHIQQNVVATACVREYQQTIPYGVMHTNDHRLLSLEEKPIQYYFVNAGIYVLQPEALQYIQPKQAFNMTDLLSLLVSHDQHTAVFPIREYWLDIGCPEDFVRAHIDYQEHFI